ncbi:hypothetical protein V494_03047, partial [Pseudogymnoascus sp. VKM F-4513 (FW-928)]
MIFTSPLAGASLLLLLAETGTAAVLQPRASGCGIVRDYKGQTHTGKTIESGGYTRTYDVYLPPNYDENKPNPLIISYHGAHGTSAKQRGLDHFDDNNWNPEHVVVWPNGHD